jgi:NAD-dependent deacetylase
MAGSDLAIQKAADLLRSARHAVVFTGAGISTPSGIPDFQSQDTGLWQRFDPMEVASIGVFKSRPEKFYGWLRPLLHEIWAAEPNPAHKALAELEAAGVVKALITQNIDNLHQRAGSKNIYEVHGSLRSMTCPRCHDTLDAIAFRDALTEENAMPLCPTCHKVLKPDIVLYGEMLPTDVWSDAEDHCRQADVILVAGSSLTVWPAAALPEVCVEHGASLILNNRTPTPLDARAAVQLSGDVAEVIPAIARLIL